MSRIPLLALSLALAAPAWADTPPPAEGSTAPLQASPACPPCPCAGTGAPPFSGGRPAFAPPWAAPGNFGPPPFAGYSRPPMDAGQPYAGRSVSLRIERHADENEYSVRIFLNGQPPENVRVANEGRWLVLHTADSQSEDSHPGDQAGDYYSFQRSYHSAQRRLTLPPDADIANMTRSDSDGLVELHIPRLR